MANTTEDLAVDTRRLTAPEIFHAAQDNAREELKRSSRTLAFSGVLSGDPLLFWLTVAVTCIGAIAVVIVEGPARLSREQSTSPDARVAPDYKEYVYSQG